MNIVTNFAVVVGAVIAAVGVWVAVRTMKADHERRKKQSTIEFYQEITSLTMPLREDINAIFGQNAAVNPADAQLQKDVELQKAIARYLSTMERLAVGINAGVYDRDLYMRCAGRTTIDWFERLTWLIKSKRSEGNRPWLYTDFESLVDEMREKYRQGAGKKTSLGIS
ncbi:MAG: DUF4760 domain-containing protein [Christensenellaceae bacterium]|nr:DUF4760 domain-containing protein [Christensenellaceae bacterium]